MSIRVLIVDHHEQIRRLVRVFFLSEFGFQICGEAVDAYEAIMKAQLLKPDLVVLEVAIPPLSQRQGCSLDGGSSPGCSPLDERARDLGRQTRTA